MFASFPLNPNPVKVTVFPVPTFLSEKVAEPATISRLSVLILPMIEAPVISMFAVVSPLYTLSSTETLVIVTSKGVMLAEPFAG